MPEGLTPRRRATRGEGTIRCLATIAFRARSIRSMMSLLPLETKSAVAVGGQEVGRAAAHRLAVVRRRTDQQTRLQATDDLGRFRMGNVDAPDRERFGHIRFAQSRYFASLKFDTVASLRTGIAEGRKREPAPVKITALRRRHGAVFEQSDIRGVNLVAHDRQRIGIASHRRRADDLPPLGVDHRDAEVCHIRTVKMFAIATHLHVGGVAVVESATAQFAVQRNRTEFLGRGHVEDVNGARVSAAPIQRSSIRREVGAAAVYRPFFLLAFQGRINGGHDRFGRAPVSNDLADAVAGDEQRLAVTADGQTIRIVAHRHMPPDRLQVAAGGKNSQPVGVVRRIRVDRGRVQIRLIRGRCGQGQPCEGNDDGQQDLHGCFLDCESLIR